MRIGNIDSPESARSLPIAEVANRFNEIPKTGRVVLYCDCKTYDIADRAVFIEYRGYRNIFVMPEGDGWKDLDRLLSQVELLRKEKPRAPAPDEPVH